MFLLFVILLIFSILFEGTVTTLPLVMICLLCLTILRREVNIFFIAFLAGLILDIVTVKTLGSESLFFVVFVFLILLYQSKYEINSYPFVAVAALVGAFGFLWIFGGNLWLDSILSSFIALLFFTWFRLINQKN
ncbi:MAG TPA: hypothetical protein VF810_01045 [Patescibacteria group bacterium]